MVPVVPLVRRFRHQLKAFRPILKNNWMYRRIVFLLEKWLCLQDCEGAVITDTVEVGNTSKLLRYPTQWVLRTTIANIGSDTAYVAENGVIAAIIPANTSKEVTLTNRYRLEATSIMGTTLVVTTHRRCECGETDPQPPDPTEPDPDPDPDPDPVPWGAGLFQITMTGYNVQEVGPGTVGYPGLVVAKCKIDYVYEDASVVAGTVEYVDGVDFDFLTPGSLLDFTDEVKTKLTNGDSPLFGFRFFETTGARKPFFVGSVIDTDPPGELQVNVYGPPIDPIHLPATQFEHYAPYGADWPDIIFLGSWSIIV
jgi:hypothetical protein